MRAGQLNHRIRFVTYKQIPDGAGGTTPEEQVIYQTQANVSEMKKIRTSQGEQSLLIGGWQIKIRYRRDVDILKTWHIRYKDKLFAISSVQQINEDRQMVLIYAVEKE